MTSEQQEAKRRAEVMLAFAEGKDIEMFVPSQSAWTQVSSPSWKWTLYDYRVKPGPVKPRRCKVRYYKDQEDPWGCCYGIDVPIKKHNDLVQLIELTPEVIAALGAAGIEYEK